MGTEIRHNSFAIGSLYRSDDIRDEISARPKIKIFRISEDFRIVGHIAPERHLTPSDHLAYACLAVGLGILAIYSLRSAIFNFNFA